VAVVVDGFQNLRERYVVTLGEKIAQRIGLTGIECRGGNVKRPVLAQLEWGLPAARSLVARYWAVNATFSLANTGSGSANSVRPARSSRWIFSRCQRSFSIR